MPSFFHNNFIKRALLVILIAATSASAFLITPQSPLANRYQSSELNMSTQESFSLSPEETALVLIEYQNEFTTEGGGLYEAVKECIDKTGTLENSKKVMDAAREAGCTIIHVPISFALGHHEISKKPYGILAGVKEGALFKEGEWGSAICDIMKPSEGDIVAKGKNGLCGFQSTNLDFLLRQNGIKNIVLGGFLTNCCVESTMRSA